MRDTVNRHSYPVVPAQALCRETKSLSRRYVVRGVFEDARMSPTLSAVAVASTVVALGTDVTGLVWQSAIKIVSRGVEARCSALSVEDVQVVPHGFLIVSRDEFVPQEQALPSSQRGYWFCVTDGDRRTLMVPPEQF